MLCIGLDVHKKKTTIALLDDDTGEREKPYDVPTIQLREHVSQLPDPKRMVMETSTIAHFVGRDLRTSGLDVMVVHAHKAHLLLGGLSNSKTDKLDAIGLAFLLAKGMLETAEVWLPGEAEHELRELNRVRRSLTEDSVRLQNRIRKYLSRQGLDCPHSDLQGQRATAWLDEQQRALSPTIALALDGYRSSLAGITAQLDRLSEAVKQQAEHHPLIRRLLTMPGIGPILGAIIFGEIGDIARFESACKLRGYTTLVPKIDQSAETRRIGHLVKHGNRLLSWALIQVAQNFAAAKATQELTIVRNYRRKVYIHGPNPAKVDLARRLTNIIFAMLRDGTDFTPELLTRTESD